jgi:hypothetical protein
MGPGLSGPAGGNSLATTAFSGMRLAKPSWVVDFLNSAEVTAVRRRKKRQEKWKFRSLRSNRNATISRDSPAKLGGSADVPSVGRQAGNALQLELPAAGCLESGHRRPGAFAFGSDRIRAVAGPPGVVRAVRGFPESPFAGLRPSRLDSPEPRG